MLSGMTPDSPVRLTVGEFSRMTYLSVKSLHHYHEIGLLPPTAVDPANGYRLYAADQVPTAQLIRRLRDLEMPLDDVRAVLEAPDDAARDAAIGTHLRHMEDRLEETQATVASLRTLLEQRNVPGEVVFRRVPESTVVAIAGQVAFDDAEAWLEPAYGELHHALASRAIAPTGPDGALYPDEMFQQGEGRVVAFVPVPTDAFTSVGGEGRVEGRVVRQVLPAQELAVSLHIGPFEDLDRTYGALGTTLASRGIATTGPVREHYLDTEPDAPPRTEVCWPVVTEGAG
jgi:DNA-binding transcriptional MerR regulator